MSELVELVVRQMHSWSYVQIIFLAGFTSQAVLNNNPTVWLDVRLPPITLIMCLTNSLFDKRGQYEKYY
jgi:hypothetical protein